VNLLMKKNVLETLRKELTSKDVAGVEQCVTRLHKKLPHKDNLYRNTVLAAYGGGKDSTYTTAFIRAVHLSMLERYGQTFMLRIVTMRHSGMPKAVMENIDRAYTALGVYQDPSSELLMIENNKVLPFSVSSKISRRLLEKNRIDMLISGHRSYGDGRTTFCNACNFNVANALSVAVSYNGGVDLIVSGESKDEQRAYIVWIGKLAAQAGLGVVTSENFERALEILSRLSHEYFSEIHGVNKKDSVHDMKSTKNAYKSTSFFSIYEDTNYSCDTHWSFLTGFLGFSFDDLAFSFTESDCVNPAIMAHLRGLRTEHVYKLTYYEGVEQYFNFAIDLMKKKDFPRYLVDLMKRRYSTEVGMLNMRNKIEKYMMDTYNLNSEQLVCMVFSPFASACSGLRDYLIAEQRDLLSRENEICQILEGKQNGGRSLIMRLERISGICFAELMQIYNSDIWTPAEHKSNKFSLLSAMNENDPYQKLVWVDSAGSDRKILDRISGR